MTIREKLAQFKELAQPAEGANYALVDADGIALAIEIGTDNCRHTDKLKTAVDAVGALPDRPDADAPIDTLISWAVEQRKARDAFWAEFEGESVDGLTIIRKR